MEPRNRRSGMSRCSAPAWRTWSLLWEYVFDDYDSVGSAHAHRHRVYASDTSHGEGMARIVRPPHRSFIVGSTLRSFIVRSAGCGHVVGASLLPTGVQPLLGVPARIIGESIALLDDILGSTAGEIEEIIFAGRAIGALRAWATLWSFGRLREPQAMMRAPSTGWEGVGQKGWTAGGRDEPVCAATRACISRTRWAQSKNLLQVGALRRRCSWDPRSRDFILDAFRTDAWLRRPGPLH